MSVEKTKDEIEVTPAMIEAGSRALANYDPSRWSNEETAVVIEDVYIAMEKLRRKSES
jgi:hypothetical protein